MVKSFRWLVVTFPIRRYLTSLFRLFEPLNHVELTTHKHSNRTCSVHLNLEICVITPRLRDPSEGFAAQFVVVNVGLKIHASEILNFQASNPFSHLRAESARVGVYYTESGVRVT